MGIRSGYEGTFCEEGEKDQHQQPGTELLEMVKKAKRPFIYAGGGVIASGAEKEVLELSRRLDAAVGLSMMGLTSVPGLLSAEPGHVRHARTVRLHHGPVPVRSAVCCGRAVFGPGPPAT